MRAGRIAHELRLVELNTPIVLIICNPRFELMKVELAALASRP